MEDIKVGTKVILTEEWAEYHKKYPNIFPKPGTEAVIDEIWSKNKIRYCKDYQYLIIAANGYNGRVSKAYFRVKGGQLLFSFMEEANNE